MAGSAVTSFYSTSIPAPPPPPAFNYLGVNALDFGDVSAYGSTEQPFLNLLKQSGSNYSSIGCPWWTRNAGGGDTNEEGFLTSNLDSDFYPKTLSGLVATYVETWMNVNIIADTPLPGAPNSGNATFPAQAAAVTYRLQFQGKCTLNIPNATGLSTPTPGVTVLGTQITSTNVWGSVNTVLFTTTTNIHLQITALPDSSNYFKAASIVDNTLAASYDAGEILHPLFKSFLNGAGAAKGFSRLRCMGGLRTNAQDINLMFQNTLASGSQSGAIASANNGSSSVSWPFPTGTFQAYFSTGDIRGVAFTNGGDQSSWTGGLSAQCSTTSVPAGRGAMASVALYTWATRPLPSNMSWAVYALPYEVCIQACNEIGMDFWCNLPATALLVDATFIGNLANLIFNGTGASLTNWNVSTFNGLNTNQVVYTEYSNEISGGWNGGSGYAQGTNVLLLAAVENGLYAANSNQIPQATAEFYGVQCALIADGFASVYGSVAFASRVKATMMTQFATGNGNTFIQLSMNTPHWTFNAYKHNISVWGFAPYCPLADSIAALNTTDAAHLFGLSAAAQITELYSLAYTNVGASGYTYSTGFPSDGWVGDVFGSANGVAGMIAGVATQPWKAYLVACYEIGINANARAGIPNASYTLAQFTALMTGFLRDPRIAFIYYDPSSALSAHPGYLQGLLNFGITGNHLGGVAPTTAALSTAGWGLIENIMQMVGISAVLATVPRYQGTNNFINIPTALIPDASVWAYLGAFYLPTDFNGGGSAWTFGPVLASNPDASGNSTNQVAYCASFNNKCMGAFLIPKDARLSVNGPYNTAYEYIVPPGGASSAAISNYILANSKQTGGASFGAGISAAKYDAANGRVMLGYIWEFTLSYLPAAGPQYATYNCASIDSALDLSSLQIDYQIASPQQNALTGVGGQPVVLDGCNYGCGWGSVPASLRSTLGGTTIATLGAVSTNGARNSRGPVLTCFSPESAPLAPGTVSANNLLWYGNLYQPNLWIGNPIGSGPFVNPPSSNPQPPYDLWGFAQPGGQSAFYALPTMGQYWSFGDRVATTFGVTGTNTVIVAGLHGSGVSGYTLGVTTQATSGLVSTVYGAQTYATFTATATAGSNQLTNVSVTNGGSLTVIPQLLCAIDANGFFTTFAGFNNGSVTAASISGTTITMSGGSLNTAAIVSGTYTFALTQGDANLYDPVWNGGSAKGYHSYPYDWHVWYYDATKLSTSNQQQLPYYVGSLPAPPNTAVVSQNYQGFGHFDDGPQGVGGPTPKRLYMKISQNTVNGAPLIGVWQYTAA